MTEARFMWVTNATNRGILATDRYIEWWCYLVDERTNCSWYLLPRLDGCEWGSCT